MWRAHAPARVSAGPWHYQREPHLAPSKKSSSVILRGWPHYASLGYVHPLELCPTKETRNGGARLDHWSPKHHTGRARDIIMRRSAGGDGGKKWRPRRRPRRRGRRRQRTRASLRPQAIILHSQAAVAAPEARAHPRSPANHAFGFPTSLLVGARWVGVFLLDFRCPFSYSLHARPSIPSYRRLVLCLFALGMDLSFLLGLF